jgi:hypothetical protein
MSTIQQLVGREQRARRLLSDCREFLNRGDGAGAVHCLMQAVTELGDSSGHTTASLHAAFVERLSSMEDINTLLSRLEISTRETASGKPAALPSVESSRNSSQQFFDYVDMRHAQPTTSVIQSSNEGLSQTLSSVSGSFQCPHCHGVFSSGRRDQHMSRWCPAVGMATIDHSDDDSDSDMVT